MEQARLFRDHLDADTLSLLHTVNDAKMFTLHIAYDLDLSKIFILDFFFWRVTWKYISNTPQVGHCSSHKVQGSGSFGENLGARSNGFSLKQDSPLWKLFKHVTGEASNILLQRKARAPDFCVACRDLTGDLIKHGNPEGILNGVVLPIPHLQSVSTVTNPWVTFHFRTYSLYALLTFFLQVLLTCLVLEMAKSFWSMELSLLYVVN